MLDNCMGHADGLHDHVVKSFTIKVEKKIYAVRRGLMGSPG